MRHCFRYESITRGRRTRQRRASGEGGDDEASGWRRRTFNRGIIFIDEVALDQLDRQARFTHAASTDDDEFILSQKLDPGLASRHWGTLKKARHGIDREGRAMMANRNALLRHTFVDEAIAGI